MSTTYIVETFDGREDGKSGNGVSGREQRAKDKAVEEGELVDVAVLTKPEDAKAHHHRRDDRAKHGKDQNRRKVFEK
jgi:hypothetical protein